jgi:hypothetical protein
VKPFNYWGEEIGQPAFKRFEAPCCRLSLLGLGGGGGGLTASADTKSGVTGPTSGGTITINNGSSGPLSMTTWLIIGGVALFGLILLEVFRGRK